MAPMRVSMSAEALVSPLAAEKARMSFVPQCAWPDAFARKDSCGIHVRDNVFHAINANSVRYHE